jgi:hypothetical protein
MRYESLVQNCLLLCLHCAAAAAAAASYRRLPQPGEGPSRDLMLNGYWKHTMIGLTETAAGEQPQVWVFSCRAAPFRNASAAVSP